ncbi:MULTISPECIES: protealysin inhibitor emfourin [unclassified Streptomyces]|uniref:protealysin inhibitor emfourin n=1 Tax=unclassified Streptomyces TaxID=2593676 RepID=UPI0035E32A2E
MRIRVRRTGGFAGRERSAEIDTSDHPDAGELASLAETVLSDGEREGRRGVPDGFSYEITVDGRTVHCDDPDLTEAQRALIQRVLKEGA